MILQVFGYLEPWGLLGESADLASREYVPKKGS